MLTPPDCYDAMRVVLSGVPTELVFEHRWDVVLCRSWVFGSHGGVMISVIGASPRHSFAEKSHKTQVVVRLQTPGASLKRLISVVGTPPVYVAGSEPKAPFMMHYYNSRASGLLGGHHTKAQYIYEVFRSRAPRIRRSA